MNKSLGTFKYKKAIVVIAIVVFSLFIIFLNIGDKEKKPEVVTSQTENKIISLKNIVPGKTSVEKINELLGTPIESTKSGSLDIYNYKSSNQYRQHQVYSKDGLSELIVEEIVNGEKTSYDIQRIYGAPPEILYEKTLTSFFNLYVYPNNGIAYLGHEDGTILEVWYFVPTKIEDFISKWGSGFSREPSKEIPKY